MKHFLLIAILSFPSLLFGQAWELNKINEDSKYRYEYWLTFENGLQSQSAKDSTLRVDSVIEPVVYQINSKNKLTNQEKELIEKCIIKYPEEYYKKCSDKRKYKIYMQI